MRDNVTVLIGGDFFPGGRITKLIDRHDIYSIFNDVLSVIHESDLAVINLEAPLIEKGVPIRKIGPTLKGPSESMEVLKKAGFGLVTLANNHIMDYGPEGLESTINLSKQYSIGYVGAGLNYMDATRTFFTIIKGIKIGFINLTENEFSVTYDNSPGAHPLSIVKNFKAIQDSRKNCDFLFVIVHGGHENHELPSPTMRETLRFLASAGASAIVCHHSHCFSGYEIHNGVPIFYGIGNFIFDNPNKTNTPWNEGYIVRFSLVPELSFDLIPYNQCNVKPGVYLKKTKEYALFAEKIKFLNAKILSQKDLEIAFRDYCKSVEMTYNRYLEPHSSRLLFYLQRKSIIPLLFRKRKRILLKNLITCESHRETMIELLSK